MPRNNLLEAPSTFLIVPRGCLVLPNMFLVVQNDFLGAANHFSGVRNDFLESSKDVCVGERRLTARGKLCGIALSNGFNQPFHRFQNYPLHMSRDNLSFRDRRR